MKGGRKWVHGGNFSGFQGENPPYGKKKLLNLVNLSGTNRKR